MGRTAVRVIGTVAAMALAAAAGWFGVVTFVEPRSSGRPASVYGTEAVPAAADGAGVPAVTTTPPARRASEPEKAEGTGTKDKAAPRGAKERPEGPGADGGGRRSGKPSDQATQ